MGAATAFPLWVVATVVTISASIVTPSVPPIPLSSASAPLPLNATANFGGWTWTGTGSPCESGSHLTFYAHLFGNASGGTPPYSFTWTLGDGTNSSSGQEVTHAYVTGDGWTAILSVRDSTGEQASGSILVAPPTFSCPAEYPPLGTGYDVLFLTLFAVLIVAIVLAVVVVVERRARRPPPGPRPV